jgi:hypothetical protein
VREKVEPEGMFDGKPLREIRGTKGRVKRYAPPVLLACPYAPTAAVLPSPVSDTELPN